MLAWLVMGRSLVALERRVKSTAEMLDDGDWEFGISASVQMLGADSNSLDGRYWEVLARTGTGDAQLLGATERLVARVRSKEIPVDARWSFANTIANAFITAGRYREALAVETMWGDAALFEARELMPPEFCLLQVNLAEAEYNLGLWKEASERVEVIEDLELSVVTAAGVLMQLAWIAAHDGDAQLARDFAFEVSDDEMPGVYKTEVHYTQGVALLTLGDLEGAERSVRRGLELAKRRSSDRNGLFLLGRIFERRGDTIAAERMLRAGAGHAYRGQGGDGLLLWGDVLARMDRRDEARAAWSLAIERDGQSESAHLARSR